MLTFRLMLDILKILTLVMDIQIMQSIEVSVAAVALGASVIRHFTISRDMKGQIIQHH